MSNINKNYNIYDNQKDKINNADIVCGLAWGDEAKGKIVSSLLKKNQYDCVCRWSGSHNAGHTIFINKKKYVTHLIPAGIFYNIKSYIGPDCLVNIDELVNELTYLKNNGFNTNYLFISPNAHVIQAKHVKEDLEKYTKTQGSTGKGVAPCARDKYARVGLRICDLNEEILNKLKPFNKLIILDIDNLYGNILCEGAQGNWLDINYGNYPYVTSANTFPFSACTLGFSPRKIRNIYGAAKIYDTRVGVDPFFSDDLLKQKSLSNIADVGNEFGATTGRLRKVNWLNVDKLIHSINISGTNYVIISKTDILEKVGEYKFIYNDLLMTYHTINNMKEELSIIIKKECIDVDQVIFSNSPFDI